MNYLELLSKLIAFDTTSRNSNRELIDFIAEYLAKYGISSHLSLSSCQTKANLVATLPAADGSLVGGLVLSGHTDVVPVDGQNWSYPPFASYNKTWTPSLKTLLPQDFHYCIFQPADL